MKPSTTLLSVMLAALTTLLGTVAWAPATFDTYTSSDRISSARDNCTVQALLPGTFPTATPEVPWFLGANTGTTKTKSEARQVLAGMGLKFTENRGQATDQFGKQRSDVLYYGGTKDAQLYFTRTGIGYVFYAEAARPRFNENGQRRSVVGETPEKRYVMQMELIGSNPQASVVGQDQAHGIYNYVRGEQKDWIIGVPSYHTVLYRDVYKNIDMVVTTQNSGVKYDFVVKPGGDPSQIRFRYAGSQKVAVSSQGKIQVTTPVGTIKEARPFSYQGTEQHEVKNAYSVRNGVVSFNLGSYDATQTLVIDPTVIWSTFFGGDGTDSFEDIEIRDADGAFVAVGHSNATSIPPAGTPTNFMSGGAPAVGAGLYTGANDALIARFNADNSLVWFTFVGGTRDDQANSVELDGGNIYVMGTTSSKADATQKFPQVGTVPQPAKSNDATADAWVACFSDAGKLLWSSFKGGGGEDLGLRLSVRTINGMRVLAGTGSTISTNFPTAIGSSSNCPSFLQMDYHGGTHDAYIFRWVETGGAIPNGVTEQWSTYLGGDANDVGTAIELDSQGSVLIAGYTESMETSDNPFPAIGGPGIITKHFNSTNGSAEDGYIGKLDSNGCLQSLGYIGGNGNDEIFDGALDASDRFYVIGSTLSDSLSGTFALPDGVGQRFRGNSEQNGDGSNDAFIAVLGSSTGASDQQCVLQYASYHGGSTADWGTDVDVLDNSVAAGETVVFVCGFTQSQANSLSTPGIPTAPRDNQCGSTANALQAELNNPTSNTNDMWVACFNPTCCRLWSSYWGGSDNDQAFGISASVQGAGAAAQDVVVVSGITSSDGVPGPPYPTINPGGSAFIQDKMELNGRVSGALLKVLFARNETSLSVPAEPITPTALQISSISPNPASEEIRLSLSLKKAGMITVEIFSADGRQEMMPIDRRSISAGEHRETISVKSLTPGVYTVRVSTGSDVRTRQFLVVR